MIWALIIWLGTPDNFAIYSTFDTLEECRTKMAQVQRALDQSGSAMRLSCLQHKKEN